MSELNENSHDSKFCIKLYNTKFHENPLNGSGVPYSACADARPVALKLLTILQDEKR
jgi:hypothetical protein